MYYFEFLLNLKTSITNQILVRGNSTMTSEWESKEMPKEEELASLEYVVTGEDFPKLMAEEGLTHLMPDEELKHFMPEEDLKHLIPERDLTNLLPEEDLTNLMGTYCNIFDIDVHQITHQSSKHDHDPILNLNLVSVITTPDDIANDNNNDNNNKINNNKSNNSNNNNIINTNNNKIS